MVLPGQKVRPYLQNDQLKKGWRYDSVVEYLPNKHKTLSSNPNDTRKKEKNWQNMRKRRLEIRAKE
jgi:hypothetical protein